jgi:hypothetical protein
VRLSTEQCPIGYWEKRLKRRPLLENQRHDCEERSYVTLRYLKGKGAESEEAQEYANNVARRSMYKQKYQRQNARHVGSVAFVLLRTAEMHSTIRCREGS